MIRVLFFIPTFDKGGAENVLLNLVNHMDQNQFEITVQTLFDQNSQKKVLKKGIRYKTFLDKQFHGNSRLQALIPPGILYKTIVKEKYDIIVSYLEGPTTHIISGCPFRDTKKVAWIHTTMDTDRRLNAGFSSKKQAIQAYKNMDQIVFVANEAKKQFEERIGEQVGKSCVLYNTIESDVIRRMAKESVQDMFDNTIINIIAIGKISHVKGYDRLVHVHKRLVEAGYIHRIYVLGSGNDRPRLEKYIEQNHLTESFIFLGFQDNPYKYLARADLFVCSSRREGFSTAVSEALILGIPVVSTNCSGTRELLGDNEYGIVTENSEVGLYEGIKRMLSSRELICKYREKAKARGSCFSIEDTVRQVEKMLRSLLP